MASFLDKTGLTKFWELIKQYLEENFTSKSTTNTLTQRFNIFSTTINLSEYPLNFSVPYQDHNKLEFGGKNNPRLNSLSILGNILINIFFDKLFYLFDVTSNNVSDLSIGDVIKGINLSPYDKVYLGRVYSNNNRGINRNLDVYLNKTSHIIQKYDISIIPVEDGKVLFSDGLFPLETLYREDINIQDPIIPDLTLDKLRNNLDNYLPYLENKSTEIKFKVEYVNAIRGLLKIYKKSAGNNSLELIGKDSPEDTNFSKHITPREIVTTYLEPGDRLYMYGTLSSIPDEDSLMTNNIIKLLPTLPGTYQSEMDSNRNKYIINIIPCTAEGTPLDRVDLDQHYLEYGGNIRGMLGYQIDGYNQDSPIFPGVGYSYLSFISFIAYCKYIGKINVNPTLDKLNTKDIHHIEFNQSLLNSIPIYQEAFSKTSVKKGYISIMLYSEGNLIRETVHSFSNFKSSYYDCSNLTELDVFVDWYDNSKVPDNILDKLSYQDISSGDSYYVLRHISKHIISNVSNCVNIKKITLKYKADKPYSDKIRDFIDKIKDHILSNIDSTGIVIKDINKKAEYTIDIQSI